MKRSPQEIQDWIVDRVSTLTGIAAAQIDPDAAVLRYGLDSIAVVALVSDLETWLGVRIHDNPLESQPTIAGLARWLAEQVSHG
jgi:acyl carrier protein